MPWSFILAEISIIQISIQFIFKSKLYSKLEPITKKKKGKNVPRGSNYSFFWKVLIASNYVVNKLTLTVSQRKYGPCSCSNKLEEVFLSETSFLQDKNKQKNNWIYSTYFKTFLNSNKFINIHCPLHTVPKA